MLDLTQIDEAIRYEGRISRRLLLAYGSALAALPALGLRAASQPKKKAKLPGDVFKHLGVASGEPDADSVVLWTRLAPEPLEKGGGMPDDTFDVDWEIWPDEGQKKVIDRGKEPATDRLGHSVHAVARNLSPDTWYRYQFHCGGQSSPVGRTRTMPSANRLPGRLRFAFASCQNYEDGYYNAYEHMAKDNLDLVVFLGDYIYENDAPEKTVREHHGKRSKKVDSLADYRVRYGQYKSDPLLKEMHRLCPWLVTWDDHEVEGNYADDISKKKTEGKGPTKKEFLERRAHAYQAYYEHMPVRPGRAKPDGHRMHLYHNASFGRLVSFNVLDTRQYRTDQPNGGEAGPINKDAQDARNTLLGAKQKEWLRKTLADSTATWNVLAQQVMMALVDRATGDKQQYSMDAWPGYFHERDELLRFLAERRIRNPVVLTGDIHSNWVNDLRVDDRKEKTPVVAAEFVVTSISSKGNGKEVDPKRLAALRAQNPCLKYHDDQRGYVRCTVTPKEWKSEYQAVSDVTKPGGKAWTTATFVVAEGEPGVKK